MARLARAFGWTMAEVRSMTYRDIAAMGQVLAEEAAERAKARAKAEAKAKAGRRR